MSQSDLYRDNSSRNRVWIRATTPASCRRCIKHNTLSILCCDRSWWQWTQAKQTHTQYTHTYIYTVHCITPRQHGNCEWVVRSHKFFIVGSFCLLKDVLHVGKIKVAASGPTENVENVAARRFKMARGIVAGRGVDLLWNINKRQTRVKNVLKWHTLITCIHRF